MTPEGGLYTTGYIKCDSGVEVDPLKVDIMYRHIFTSDSFVLGEAKVKASHSWNQIHQILEAVEIQSRSSFFSLKFCDMQFLDEILHSSHMTLLIV